MDKDFSLILVKKEKEKEMLRLEKSNERSRIFGLELSKEQISTIIDKRFESLSNNGRIEFGEGIISKLVDAFCDSPFVSNDNYEQTLIELQDSFYYFKNESEENYSDDELISLMKKYFDEICMGSIDYLNSSSIEELTRKVRNSCDDYGKEL